MDVRDLAALGITELTNLSFILHLLILELNHSGKDYPNSFSMKLNRFFRNYGLF